MPDLHDFDIIDTNLEFLREKELEGNLVTLTAVKSSTTGVKITYTVPSGKTFFLLKASFCIVDQPGATLLGALEVVLKMNAVIIDTMGNGGGSNTVSASGSAANIFKTETSIIGKSLVGDGTKTVVVEVIANAIANNLVPTLLGWVEDTE